MKRLTALLISTLLPVLVLAQDLRQVEIRTAGDVVIPSGSFDTQLIDASDDAVEYVFQASEDATVTNLCFQVGVRTGTSAGPVYKATLYTVSTTTGRANAIITGTAAANCESTYTPPNNSTHDSTVQCTGALPGACNLTRGQSFAIVVKMSSGATGGQNISVAYGSGSNVSPVPRNLYVVPVNGGTGTKVADMYPIAAWKTASRVFGYPYKGYQQVYVNVDNSPDEYALAFSVPGPSGQTYKISGAAIPGWNSPSTGQSFKMTLYTGTTVLQDVTIDGDIVSNNDSGYRMKIYFDESALSDLTFNTTYRLGITGTTAMSPPLTLMKFEAAGDQDALPLGTGAYVSSRTDEGAWTDDTTKRPAIDLILDKFNAAGGGSETFTGTHINRGFN